MTMPTQAVLRLLVRAYLETSEREVYGLQLCEVLGLGPGTVYPILAKLHQEYGWIDKREEQADAGEVGRATRFYYRLNEDGLVSARLALAEATARQAVRGSALKPLWEES